MKNSNTGAHSAPLMIASAVQYGTSAYTHLNSITYFIQTRKILINSVSERDKKIIHGETLLRILSMCSTFL